MERSRESDTVFVITCNMPGFLAFSLTPTYIQYVIIYISRICLHIRDIKLNWL